MEERKMKYYELSADVDKENVIICHYYSDFNVPYLQLIVGEKCESWNDDTEFYFLSEEGNIWTDYLFNDKGWFLVSKRLRAILEKLNTDIQFLRITVKEKNNVEPSREYFAANILRMVDALCLEKSKYFETNVKGIGTVYTISEYGVYANRTEGSDVFKLKKWQNIPIFVSETFKKVIEAYGITGISLREINVDDSI